MKHLYYRWKIVLQTCGEYTVNLQSSTQLTQQCFPQSVHSLELSLTTRFRFLSFILGIALGAPDFVSPRANVGVGPSPSTIVTAAVFTGNLPAPDPVLLLTCHWMTGQPTVARVYPFFKWESKHSCFISWWWHLSYPSLSPAYQNIKLIYQIPYIKPNLWISSAEMNIKVKNYESLLQRWTHFFHTLLNDGYWWDLLLLLLLPLCCAWNAALAWSAVLCFQNLMNIMSLYFSVIFFVKFKTLQPNVQLQDNFAIRPT